MRRLHYLMLICVMSMVASAAHAQAPSFQGLGTLGGSVSFASDVSDDGLVVVGTAAAAAIDRAAYRWTSAGGMIGIGGLAGANRGFANGVSADGSVIIGEVDIGLGNREAFRWTAATGVVSIGFLPGHVSSEGHDLSADGTVLVGRSLVVGSDFAFRWTSAGGMVSLGDLAGGAISSGANAVSSDGAVVVGSSSSALGNEAFRWTQVGSMVGLGVISGGFISSSANTTSTDGSVVAGSSSSTLAVFGEAFRWTQAGCMVGLGLLPGGLSATFPNSSVRGMSSDGSVAVGDSTFDASGASKAFIWDSTNGMRDLNDVLINDFGLDLTGWVLTSAQAITPDVLTIVGNGKLNGVNQAWIASNLVPAPVITSQPGNTVIVAGEFAALSVTVDPPSGMTFEWTRDGVVLVDDGRIGGATTGTMSLSPAQPSDFGIYDVTATNVLGASVTTSLFAVAVSPAICPGNANGDNQVNFADITDVLSNWLAPCNK